MGLAAVGPLNVSHTNERHRCEAKAPTRPSHDTAVESATRRESHRQSLRLHLGRRDQDAPDLMVVSADGQVSHREPSENPRETERAGAVPVTEPASLGLALRFASVFSQSVSGPPARSPRVFLTGQNTSTFRVPSAIVEVVSLTLQCSM